MIVSEYPEFSWSFTRHKTLMDCELKYFRSYYSSHNGWLKNANAITKHNYRLKKIINLEMLIGEKVHDYIVKIFTNSFHENLVSEKVMFESIWNDIEEVIEGSYSAYNKWYEKPSTSQMLHEIYYENDVPVEKIEGLKERLKNIVHNFFQNKTLYQVVHKKAVIQKDTEKFRYMKKDGIKIWLKMDLHYIDTKTNKSTIVDWKTGNSNNDDRYQLALYSHYISKAYKISDLNEVEIRNEYLLNNESKTYTVKQIDVDNMKDLINLSIEHMQKSLLDVEKNVPFEESFFQRTKNQRICERCNFKEICQ